MTTPTPPPGPDPIPSTSADANSRALRTLLQNLLFDVLLAVIVVVLPLVQATTVDWSLVIGSVIKTAVVTTLSWVQRAIETRNAGNP
ncbi:hypothetical protein [Actinocrispum wychmicini]|uniref:Holin n=1 Tax=Actinocrispum wychmicini TaxID=1213861 RepID=A0A4R2JC51_9PSEU|nr:hypothetical protein [Actinocrispum wychmicini]TCO57111.1 hypothetical protein EV192_106588 [Actinocrispum wychmicini]